MCYKLVMCMWQLLNQGGWGGPLGFEMLLWGDSKAQ